LSKNSHPGTDCAPTARGSSRNDIATINTLCALDWIVLR
jgi:hypothetical protein